MGSMGLQVDPVDPKLDRDKVEAARLREVHRRTLLTTSPSVTVEQLQRVRGTDADAVRQWLHRHRKARRLVTVSYDNVVLVPSFQLDDDLEPLPEVSRRTARLLDAGTGPWGVWTWWTSHDGYLGTSPLAALQTGDLDRVDAALANAIGDPW